MIRNLFIVFLCILSNLTFAEDTWLTQVLQLQREIDLNEPLYQATFIGTHNSYNAKAYQTPLRYIDPNQTLSIYDQLDQGIRSIELDAHWTTNQHFRKEILLCHGQSNHFGCSPFDRPFGEGLDEIRHWLKAHPDEVLLLYIERHVDGHDARLSQLLQEKIGQYIYKTNSTFCQVLPTTLTKADILKAQKQVIIVTKGCNNKMAQDWKGYIFAGIGEIPKYPFSFIDAKITLFSKDPDCSRSTIFAADQKHHSLWRIFEDRTKNGSIIHPERKIFPEHMIALMACGINWPTLDLVNKGDSRLRASIWSWAYGFPRANYGECVAYHDEVGFVNQSCQSMKEGYLCFNSNNEKFQIAKKIGDWMLGQDVCRHTFGETSQFKVPINGQQMETLKELMRHDKLASIWVNYRINNGKWVANLSSRKVYG